jgi:hypothetical protein
MEAFQIVGGHGDMARAKQFAMRYLEAQKVCCGGDDYDVKAWIGMVRDPAAYVRKDYSSKWASTVDCIPELSDEDLETWMWAQKAGGELY